MVSAAVTLFKKVYQQTGGSTESAILELQRGGYTQVDTVRVLMDVFEVTRAYAEQVVANSIAWN